LRISFPRFVGDLRPLVMSGRLSEALRLAESSPSPLARVAAAHLRHLDAPPSVRDEIVGREASQQLARLEKRLNWLAVIGQLAPMLGLLGTVTGLVTAFWQIEAKAGQVQPADLASGIWEALLTTVFGLVIALPTIAVHHALDRRVALTECRMQWLAAYLNEWLGVEPGRGAREKPRAPGHAAAEELRVGVS
jgi:biopolymer transport protein ExbB